MSVWLERDRELLRGKSSTKDRLSIDCYYVCSKQQILVLVIEHVENALEFVHIIVEVS